MKILFLSAVLFISFNINCFASEIVEVKIKQISESGKSLFLARGEFEGVKNGDKGEFFLDKNKRFSLGIGEVVKTHAKYSYWFFKKSVAGGILKSGDTIFFIRREKNRYRGKKQNYSHRIFDIYSD